jgi:hypothetical protein
MDDRWTQRIADRLRWAAVSAPGGSPHAAPPAGPAPEAAETVSAVLACADQTEFVRRAYRLALSRDPSPGELAGRVKRMKAFPFFFTRERMLRRLLTSVEAELVRRAEQARAAATAHRLSAQLVAAFSQMNGSEEWIAGSVAQLLRSAERTAARLAAIEQRLPAGPGGVACGS